MLAIKVKDTRMFGVKSLLLMQTENLSPERLSKDACLVFTVHFNSENGKLMITLGPKYTNNEQGQSIRPD